MPLKPSKDPVNEIKRLLGLTQSKVSVKELTAKLTEKLGNKSAKNWVKFLQKNTSNAGIVDLSQLRPQTLRRLGRDLRSAQLAAQQQTLAIQIARQIGYGSHRSLGPQARVLVPSSLLQGLGSGQSLTRMTDLLRIPTGMLRRIARALQDSQAGSRAPTPPSTPRRPTPNPRAFEPVNPKTPAGQTCTDTPDAPRVSRRNPDLYTPEHQHTGRYTTNAPAQGHNFLPETPPSVYTTPPSSRSTVVPGAPHQGRNFQSTPESDGNNDFPFPSSPSSPSAF